LFRHAQSLLAIFAQDLSDWYWGVFELWRQAKMEMAENGGQCAPGNALPAGRRNILRDTAQNAQYNLNAHAYRA
jgi:hypothetical protein